MEITLLLRLLAAHMLTDFILQPGSWVKDRIEKGARSPRLYLHGILTAFTAYVFSGMYSNWLIPLAVFVTHTAIDYIKSTYGKRNFSHFILDQTAHILVLTGLWLLVTKQSGMLYTYLQTGLQDTAFWLILTAYLGVTWPLGLLIGSATQKWRDQIQREQAAGHAYKLPREQEPGLANAGKWIGICERVLILTFVIFGQYTAIGFLMSAKSILRFSEKDGNTQAKTEYVLLGTLLDRKSD